ncbi:hypothetical protein [Salinilacihabitans rarus]|uniref:hypothetical protein n=1 Tax=Salinilacihabitans rarus TaxID=2961596 RepID=UPI0020C92A2E|nr:hypothetical protein [Salinilacihabitans rarus]
MGDVVRYDDNVHVYQNNSDCGSKVGEFRLASRLERYDYIDEYSGAQRSEWAMSQKGFIWPLAANPDEFNYCYDCFGDQYQCWKTDEAELTQNWNRSELDDLGIYEYAPSYQDEQETSINTSISASAPKSVGVSVSIDTPKLRIQSELIDKKLKSTYGFWNIWGELDAADEDVQLGTVMAWDSKAPDSGDKVAPTYMYTQFIGPDFYCHELNGCATDFREEVYPSSSTFNFFYEYNIDDL